MATTDPETIRKWWERWPDANIGIACEQSGLFVVDLDVTPSGDGAETWHVLKTKHGIDDDGALINLTGGGGQQLIFSVPRDSKLGNASRLLGPGIDTRGRGGMFVAPPSDHRSGRAYVWEVGAHPFDREAAPLPASLRAMLVGNRQALQQQGPKQLAPRIPRSRRNETLTSLAGTLRRRGLEKEEIAHTLLDVNRNRCSPPLDEAEVDRIATSVARYAPGNNSAIHNRRQETTDPPGLLSQAAAGQADKVGDWAFTTRNTSLGSAAEVFKAPPELAYRGRAASDLPEIAADNGDLPMVTRMAWEAIVAANDKEPFLFRFGGLPGRLEHDEQGMLAIRRLDEDRMRHELARAARWYKTSRGGTSVERRPAPPPMIVVKDLLATPEPPLPVLTRIVNCPVFAQDGTLQGKAGYNDKSRVLYAPAQDFSMPPVPESPAPADVERAKNLIFDLLADFPFTSDSDRTHAVALFLEPFVREMIPGPTPLYLIEKPTPGTGAGLLVSVLSHPALGRSPSVMTEGGSEEEWRKRLTAKLLDSPQILLIDNVKRRLDSAALSSAITAMTWEDRLLCCSQMVRVPVRCTLVATGNNPHLSNEMSRRAIRIRMDARTDQPWLRTGFRHPNLEPWVAEHRASLVWAALTLVRHWMAEGKPQGGPTLGMFERWAAIMGGILSTAGIPGFLGNLQELYAHADAEAATWRHFAGVWWQKFCGQEITTADLYQLAQQYDVGPDLGQGNEHSQKVKLGLALGQQRGRRYRVTGDTGEVLLTIVQVDLSQNAAIWRLKAEVEPGKPCGPYVEPVEPTSEDRGSRQSCSFP